MEHANRGKKHASEKIKKKKEKIERLETRDVPVIRCTSQTTLSTLLFLQFHVRAIGTPRYPSHTAFFSYASIYVHCLYRKTKITEEEA